MSPKKTSLILTFFATILMTAPAAHSEVYNFTTPMTLDHNYYYTWQIPFSLSPADQIISAKITVFNINNWRRETDVMYVELLDTPKNSGVRSYYDGEGGGNNFSTWSTAHTYLTSYTDLNDYPGPAENFTYTFTADNLSKLNSYAGDGKFGLGFDPDCHYYNDGIKLTLMTHPIPEPASMLLLGTGLFGTVFLRKKKS